jgi:hypothetical protein
MQDSTFNGFILRIVYVTLGTDVLVNQRIGYAKLAKVLLAFSAIHALSEDIRTDPTIE